VKESCYHDSATYFLDRGIPIVSQLSFSFFLREIYIYIYIKLHLVLDKFQLAAPSVDTLGERFVDGFEEVPCH